MMSNQIKLESPVMFSRDVLQTAAVLIHHVLCCLEELFDFIAVVG